MASQHPVRAAIAAAAVPAAAVLAFGNQWFTENVRFEASEPLDRRIVNTVGGPFPWRFSARGGDNATTIWLAQILAVVAVVGLTFLVAWLAARAASNAGLFVAVWGGTVVATAAAYWLLLVTTYDAIYDGREIEPGLNWFWYSVFHSTDGSLWAIGIGLVAGGAAALFAGGTARPVVTGAAGPPPTWGQQPAQTAAAWGGPAPTDARPASWGTPPPPTEQLPTTPPST